MTIDISNLLSVAKESAVSAGQLTKANFYKPRELTMKGFRDVVTDSDFAAQKVITNLIMERFPTHGFMPEEENPALPTEGEVIWVIDPIDGTTNFSRQVPNYCISVAAAIDGNVVVGAIYDPMRDELFWATKGGGAWFGEQKLAVTNLGIEDAVISADWSRESDTRTHILTYLTAVAPKVRTIRCLGSAALAMTWIAAGRFDAYLNMTLSAWDHAAAALIVQEAGGMATNIIGKPLPLAQTGVLATNGLLHNQLLTCLR